MAYLDQTAFRPSCVITALPKRYRDSLARNLGQSVALSTCPVDQLETAVLTRGATLAIIGVTGDSLAVAERLSHGPHDLKVFLAHYQDTFQQDAPLNGFAGAFDLRAGPERLANMVRQSIAQSSQHASASPVGLSKSRFEMLPRFIEMQKRVPNRQGVLDLILSNFLDLISADEGMLLVPKEVGFESWEIAASCGEDTPPLGRLIWFDRSCLKKLLDQQIYHSPEGVDLNCPEDPSSMQNYVMAVPLNVNGQLAACLVSNRIDEPEMLVEYLYGAVFLLQQLNKREIREDRQRLLAQARETASSSWLLADVHGRVLHREGKEILWMVHNQSGLKDARLRDLAARSFAGESGSICIRGRRVSFGPLQAKQRRYALLRSEKTKAQIGSPFSEHTETALISFLLRDEVGSERNGPELMNELLECSCSQAGFRKAFDVKRLTSLGIEMESDSEKIPADLSVAFAVILLVARRVSRTSLTWHYLEIEKEWSLTVAVPEKELQDENCDWARNPLLQVAIQAFGLGNIVLKHGVFGFQIRH